MLHLSQFQFLAMQQLQGRQEGDLFGHVTEGGLRREEIVRLVEGRESCLREHTLSWPAYECETQPQQRYWRASGGLRATTVGGQGKERSFKIFAPKGERRL